MFKYLMIGTKGNTEDSSNMCMVWQYTCDENLEAKDFIKRFCKDFVHSLHESGDMDSMKGSFKKHCHCSTCTCNDDENITDDYFIELAFNIYLSGTIDSTSFMIETMYVMGEKGWDDNIYNKKFDKVFHVEDIDEWFLAEDDCATKYN